MSNARRKPVALEIAVSMAEPQPDRPTDLVFEQWSAGAMEPQDDATLNRIYIAPGQVPRIVEAMLEALRRISPPGVHADTVHMLRNALSHRKADGRAAAPPAPSTIRRLAAIIRERRQQEAEAPAAERAKAPTKAKRRRRRS
jgi:hypothetical protein